MFKISETTKQIIFVIAGLFLVCLGAGQFFAEDFKAYAIGLIFGTIFSILKLVLLEKTLEKALTMDKNKAVNYSRIHYTLRFFLTFAVLFVAIYREMDIWGVIIGVLLSSPAAYIMHFKNRNKN